jgi:hypothetical protein
LSHFLGGDDDARRLASVVDAELAERQMRALLKDEDKDKGGKEGNNSGGNGPSEGVSTTSKSFTERRAPPSPREFGIFADLASEKSSGAAVLRASDARRSRPKPPLSARSSVNSQLGGGSGKGLWARSSLNDTVDAAWDKFDDSVDVRASRLDALLDTSDAQEDAVLAAEAAAAEAEAAAMADPIKDAIDAIAVAASRAAVTTPRAPADPFPYLLPWVQKRARALSQLWSQASHPSRRSAVAAAAGMVRGGSTGSPSSALKQKPTRGDVLDRAELARFARLLLPPEADAARSLWYMHACVSTECGPEVSLSDFTRQVKEGAKAGAAAEASVTLEEDAFTRAHEEFEYDVVRVSECTEPTGTLNPGESSSGSPFATPTKMGTPSSARKRKPSSGMSTTPGRAGGLAPGGGFGQGFRTPHDATLARVAAAVDVDVGAIKRRFHRGGVHGPFCLSPEELSATLLEQSFPAADVRAVLAELRVWEGYPSKIRFAKFRAMLRPRRDRVKERAMKARDAGAEARRAAEEDVANGVPLTIPTGGGGAAAGGDVSVDFEAATPKAAAAAAATDKEDVEALEPPRAPGEDGTRIDADDAADADVAAETEKAKATARDALSALEAEARECLTADVPREREDVARDETRARRVRDVVEGPSSPDAAAATREETIAYARRLAARLPPPASLTVPSRDESLDVEALEPPNAAKTPEPEPDAAFGAAVAAERSRSRDPAIQPPADDDDDEAYGNQSDEASEALEYDSDSEPLEDDVLDAAVAAVASHLGVPKGANESADVDQSEDVDDDDLSLSASASPPGSGSGSGSGGGSAKLRAARDAKLEASRSPFSRRTERNASEAAAAVAAAAAATVDVPSSSASERERDWLARATPEERAALALPDRRPARNVVAAAPGPGPGPGPGRGGRDAQQRATEADRLRKAAAGVVLDGFKEVNSELARLERDADALEEDLEKSAATMAAIEVRLLPIRPRSRGARRSLRTFPVVTLHPRFPFNV